LADALKFSANSALAKEVVDAMTINETLFFRDDRPFKHFREKALPEILKSRAAGKSLRFWSAACSTGQEPFSISMSLSEILPKPEEWHVDILATDISERTLSQARTGEYSQFEIQRGLPIQFLIKYFNQDGNIWRINEKLRKMIRFEPFNLLENMDRLGVFDIIFCRNVLIYFDDETKKKILKNIIKRMAPDAYLFLGGSETVIGLCPELKICAECPGLYSLNSNAMGAGKIEKKPDPTGALSPWKVVAEGSVYAAKGALR
jgi:chemotaxis protein methyltransferase CheR